MNRRELRAMNGRTVHIRPQVQRRSPDGQWLRSIDDEWTVDALVDKQNVVIRLHNIATGHFVDFYTDSVYEYREPGVVVLREQLTLVGRAVEREPLADQRLAYAAAARPKGNPQRLHRRHR